MPASPEGAGILNFIKIQQFKLARSKRYHAIYGNKSHLERIRMDQLYKLTIITQKWRSQFDNWCKDNSGATAVEFALIAAPFFFLIFGLLEISLIFIVSTTLEHGLNAASRQIRTGSVQSANISQSEFLGQVCAELFGLLDCDNNLAIDVRVFSDFSNSSFTPGIDASGNFASGGFQFDAGQRNDIVLARAYYEWELITPIISAPLSNLDNGNLLISSGVAFRNEPF